MLLDDDKLTFASHIGVSDEILRDFKENEIKVGDWIFRKSLLKKKPLMLRSRKEVLSSSTRNSLKERISIFSVFY
ncbi:MAG: hypothetical protein ACUVUG_07175 [Candidatus Aminicenantia bacterium]